jgi:hypothetical protein
MRGSSILAGLVKYCSPLEKANYMTKSHCQLHILNYTQMNAHDSRTTVTEANIWSRDTQDQI